MLISKLDFETWFVNTKLFSSDIFNNNIEGLLLLPIFLDFDFSIMRQLVKCLAYFIAHLFINSNYINNKMIIISFILINISN